MKTTANNFPQNTFLTLHLFSTKMNMKRILFFGCLSVLMIACNNPKTDSSDNNPATTTTPPPANINYNIIASYPHNSDSYTQGLIWQNNSLYEGTGLENHSKLMKVDLKTGTANQTIDLANDVFGEGITIFNNKIYQLSWQNHKVFVYEAATFKKIKELDWEHEGWGLTHNDSDLIVSTGESNIYFVDSETFKIKKTISVRDNNGPVGNLNELEYVNGSIFSNIYLTDYVIKIDPSNGNIIGKMDFSGLLEKSGKQVNKDEGLVLNGIAYDSTKNSFYITGKKWPLLFEVKLN